MVKVSVFYPNGEGHYFDMGYYLDTHMPMVQARLGAALRGVSVEHGLGGSEAGAPPLYLAMGHLLFDSVEQFQQSFGTHGAEIVGDVPNFTNTRPALQVSEIKLQRG
jgi:uncharacterized protein (TIGR02118 family)